MSEIMELGGSFLEAVSFILMLWSTVSYVLSALSKHRIASRRGLGCGWLAWVPLANIWLLGRLSDQYQLVMGGRRTKRAATLLTLTILAFVLLAPAALCLYSAGAYLSSHQAEPGSVLVMILGILLLLTGGGLCIARNIVGYVADYNLYNSCRPEQAKAFLLLSIFFHFLKPFFRIASSGHDKGFYTCRGAK